MTLKKFFSAENPFRELFYISTAVIFILAIVLYKSSAKNEAGDLNNTTVSESEGATQTPGFPVDSAIASALTTEAAAGANQMNLQSFRDLTATVQEKLPTLYQIRKLTEEDVHYTPTLLRDAGLILSQIAQALHDNENLASEAAAFYENCYAREDLPVSIRGLCLADHRNIRMQWGDRAEWTFHEAQQPAAVLRLAEVIPATTKAD